MKNQRGVALLMTLALMAMLSVMVTQFFDDSMIRHDIVQNEKRRIQAEFLSRSAVGFAKLLLYHSKQIDDTIKKNNIDVSGMDYQPLYKLIPLNTGLLRGLATSQAADETGGAQTVSGQTEPGDNESGEESEASAAETFMNESRQATGILEQSKIADFLGFNGDFSVDYHEEEGKISINALSKLESNSETAKFYKKLLLQALKGPTQANDVPDEVELTKLVNAMGDFVDVNGVVNDFDTERGSENSTYNRPSVSIKNGPLLHPTEMFLIDGMTEQYFSKIEPYVTVFTTDPTLNLCMASDELLNALIVDYSLNSGCTAPIEADDNDELELIRDQVLEVCPDSSAAADALLGAMGVGAGANPTTETEATDDNNPETACAINLKTFVSTTNSVITITTHGDVDDVTFATTQVLDTSASKPSQWRVLSYFTQ